METKTMSAELSESEIKERFLPFEEKMANEGIPPLIIELFRRYYERLLRGERGLLSRRDIAPLGEADMTDWETLNGFNRHGARAIKEVVVIKLNGGLGTSMGLSQAKSLIEVKDGLCFLDIIARQIMSYRERYGVKIPLVLMDSFKTDEESTQYLERYPALVLDDIPLSFMQHKFPKVLRESLSPGHWPRDPECEWNPPGHGDIYFALITSGMLDTLIGKGYKYAFISNSDNLGASMEETLLGYFASGDNPFMIEAADRTKADTKGGHLAGLRRTGGLVLREIAQCPEEEIDEFQDINRYRFFNTNNIWVNLLSLKERLQGGIREFTLPMIVNPKRIDPIDDTSPEVYQIETAMGAAISIFENATAIRVPRTRFSPVKKSRDLLALWSDCYVMTADSRIVQNPARKSGPLRIDLDENYYKRIDQLRQRFIYGAPSLVDCESLSIKGNVYFGKGIVVKGTVSIVNHSPRKANIPDGTVITEDLFYN
jgi:UTP--glucose-1-phosphate uridylyltransferase